MRPIGYVQHGADTIQEQLDNNHAKILVDRLEIDPKEMEKRIMTKSSIEGSVITHAGLGNQKVGDKEFGYQETTGVTFVVVDGQEWYVRPMERGIGMDESRRNHERQIQAALDMDEMEYYEPMDEWEFTQSMVDWSRMDVNPVPDKFKPITVDYVRGILNDELHQTPVATYRRDTNKIGRNELCPCGSNKKYKKCCGGFR